MDDTALHLEQEVLPKVRHGTVKHALTGAIAVVQRGALRLNVHLRVLALDGVYLRATRRASSRSARQLISRGVAALLRCALNCYGPGNPSDIRRRPRIWMS
jgi:hypothetical protein